ncbi:DUF1566 domain-containing protein, partial [bacterium]|nr:DUF1566 domain-containing protein [bacterium]NIO73310.1 DUF1566 domain-containing protein [bacterium]
IDEVEQEEMFKKTLKKEDYITNGDEGIKLWSDFLEKYPDHLEARKRASTWRNRKGRLRYMGGWYTPEEIESLAVKQKKIKDQRIKRLSSAIEGRFIINGDGTVEDLSLRAMWQQGQSEEKMVWEKANNYCKNLRLAGYSNWRLPDCEELRSLIVKSNIPTINTRVFPDTQPVYYWTSKPGENELCNQASFKDGHFMHALNYHISDNGVRCIRSLYNTSE